MADVSANKKMNRKIPDSTALQKKARNAFSCKQGSVSENILNHDKILLSRHVQTL